MGIEFLEQNNKNKQTKYTYEELKEKYIDNKSNSASKKTKEIASDYNMIVSFVITIVLLIGIGILGGWYIDNYLNTKPLFIVILSLLGIAAAYRNLYVSVTRRDKKGSSKNDKS